MPSVQIIFLSRNRKNDFGRKEFRIFRNLPIQWMEELLDHADETVEGLLIHRKI